MSEDRLELINELIIAAIDNEVGEEREHKPSTEMRVTLIMNEIRDIIDLPPATS